MSDGQLSRASPSGILDLMDGYRRTKILFTAVELGIFDFLNKQPETAHQLNQHLKLDEPSLKRFLNSCVALDLLLYDPKEETYQNSESSDEYLVSTKPTSITSYLKHNNNKSYMLWSHVSDALREGTQRWHQAFHIPSTSTEETLFATTHYANEAAQMDFLDGMHGMMKISAAKIVEQFDLSKYKHLVDVGGCSGELAMTACNKYPQLRATIFDLPDVKAAATKYIHKADRIKYETGNFFKDELPNGDLYVLGRIIHDWNEQDGIKILTKIYNSLPETNGAVLIVETLLNEDKLGPVHSVLQDINMLMATSGCERSFSEYKQLLESIGFKRIEAKRTGTRLDVIIGRKH
ncbi:unnamed protein product [Didymodactylos carnosus]|uniref:Acetylserotonin O-methyltransferase n=1 Tax=Didymodactylos carnosus TaxID=1234261 RepID=A0A814WHN0_9BILA|nr:unnamed protein product [Didymodactylos carnosus]CAF1202385.1 unnamed protein product [Didymodactylos carnosus]CAF3690983.1 unnamed protein product [Didymodactylos carnosus]CAF3966804.1 unnamed protein product [Didymodactylos carnosus]